MFSTDYLVICGLAPARSMDAAGANSESPLGSSKHIIVQLLCLVQHSLTQEFQLSASFCPPIRARCKLLQPTRLTRPLPIRCEAVTLTRRTVGKLFLKDLMAGLPVIRFYTAGTIGSTICDGCRSS
jgi:hypothetical protein